MELYYNTEFGQFELYDMAFDLGVSDYVRFSIVGQNWRLNNQYVSQEVLDDALTMGVLRPATADEARALDLELI